MTNYLYLLKTEAVRRGLHDPAADLDPASVFALVRDMPYRRASDRQPETIITEWRGTCSGKHLLLQCLFEELGLPSQVMACTTVTPVEPDEIPEALRPLYDAANRRFVDIHNYLRVDLPDHGPMIVDATWPLNARDAGLPVNETFQPGVDHQLSADPIQTWPIPPDVDPETFKDELLQAHFTPAELEFREIIIHALSEKTSN